MKPLDFYKSAISLLDYEQTKTYLKQDDNFLCGLEIKDSHLDIYLMYADTKIVYFSFFNKQPLFIGDEFKPSATHSWDTLECAVDLLEWFTLQTGDIENDYFKNYTPFQIKWRDSMYAENLRMYALCFNNHEHDEKNEAENYLTNWFIQ